MNNVKLPGNTQNKNPTSPQNWWTQQILWLCFLFLPQPKHFSVKLPLKSQHSMRCYCCFKKKEEKTDSAQSIKSIDLTNKTLVKSGESSCAWSTSVFVWCREFTRRWGFYAAEISVETYGSDLRYHAFCFKNITYLNVNVACKCDVVCVLLQTCRQLDY